MVECRQMEAEVSDQALGHGFGTVSPLVGNKWSSSLEKVAKKESSERIEASGLGRKGELDEEM